MDVRAQALMQEVLCLKSSVSNSAVEKNQKIQHIVAFPAVGSP